MHKVTVLNKKDADKCAFRDVIDRIGDKWSMLIIVALKQGPLRFNELKRTIGDISQKVLTKTLKELEADGYITRTAYDTSPPKVVYELSKMGITVLRPVTQLAEWAEENHSIIKKNRVRYEKKKLKLKATIR